MLQFYVDDSSELVPHVFVLQGLIARPDQWGKFTEEWDNALLGWNMPFFKMSEVATSWSDDLKKGRLPYLRRLVHEHVLVAVDNVLEVKMLRETLASHPDRRQRNPYFFCLTNLITHLLSLPEFKDEEIQFICDEQTEKKMVRAAWKNFIDTAPPDKKSRIVESLYSVRNKDTFRFRRPTCTHGGVGGDIWKPLLVGRELHCRDSRKF